jgi:GTPase SAR1 family protein
MSNRLRIALVGPPNVGKTAFIQKVVGNRDELQQTIGVDYYRLDLKTEQLNRIPVLCWDCGSRNKDFVVDIYGPMTEGVIAFYDCSKSLNTEWIDLMTSKMQNKPAITLVATKMDKARDNILLDAGKHYAKEKNIQFRQCSIIKDTIPDLEKIITKTTESILQKNQECYKRLYHNSYEIGSYFDWLSRK